MCCFLLSAPILLPPWIPVSHCQTREDCLETAKEAAAWIKSVAVPSVQGLAWPRSSASGMWMTGLDEGSAGIGEFLLRLYQDTQDMQYLDMAEKASNYVYTEYQKGNYYGPDWLAGAAGGGTYFLDLFRVTGDHRYLDRAKSVAGWLIDNVYTDSAGYYWRHSPALPNIYTGVAHGAAGIGLFFLGLFTETGDSLYLRYAEGALTWTRQFTVNLGDSAIGWKRLSTDKVPYHLWCGGSTGMVFFLDSLYRVTHNNLYRTLLRETAAGLKNAAVPDNGGVAWHYATDDYSFPVIYCHGTASTAHALYLAGSELADETLAATARRGAEWLKKAKRPSGAAADSWPHILGWDQYDTGLFTGTASVGHAFINFFRYDPDSSYLTEAKEAAAYLLSVADLPAKGQLRWINYTSPDNPGYDVKAYYTGLYSGTAGVAAFFLELYQLMGSLESTIAKPPAQIPDRAAVSSYPNPFNLSTRVVIDLPGDESVKLELFDILGRKIRTLIGPSYMKAGQHTVTWDGTDGSAREIPSGVYFAVLEHENGIVCHKLLLLK